MQAFLVTTLVVAVAEIGDRTQLLSMLLASRFKKPVPILCGVLLSTLANHALAALAGQWIGEELAGPWLRWGLGLSFLAMAGWVLVPDRIEADEVGRLPAGNALLVTLCSFFIAEIGDKTQLVTVSLAAAYSQAVVLVIAGTTAGMLLANAPVVFIGKKFADRLPMRRIHIVASVLFIGLGALFILRAFT